MTARDVENEHPATGEPPAGYAAAVTELEDILRSIEDAEVDVDQLAAQVARASFLIGWCRDRLDGARDAVADIAPLDSED